MKRSVRYKPQTNREGKENGQDSQIRGETLSSPISGVPAPEEENNLHTAINKGLKGTDLVSMVKMTK